MIRKLSLALVFLPLLAGCPQASMQDLEPATQAFARHDYASVIQQTEQLIRSGNLRGNDLASALYLQGRAYEELVARDEAEKHRNLAAARRAYVAALEQRPERGLEGRIRTGVANVAYFQEDFPTAIQQWNAAYSLTDVPDQRPWILYRIGLSQQRLGQFELADRTFVQVQQEYPDTIPARRAKAHHGYREFNVQIGVFHNHTLAQNLYDNVRKLGHPTRLLDSPEGRHVMVGPARTWAAARQLRDRVAQQYPEAIIVP